MTPDQISALTAIASALKVAGTLPFGALVILIVVGPWIGMFIMSISITKNLDKSLKVFGAEFVSQEKRFESVVKMYENNVEVVRDYNHLAGDLTSIITLVTRTLEGLVQKIDNNQWCPLARKGAGRE